MRQREFISMVKHWERVSSIEDYRLIKQALLVMLQNRRKGSWQTQGKNILDRTGLGNLWNEERG